MQAMKTMRHFERDYSIYYYPLLWSLHKADELFRNQQLLLQYVLQQHVLYI